MMNQQETTAAWQWEELGEMITKKQQEGDWYDILKDIELNEEEKDQIEKLRSERAARGDNEWAGDDMHKKLNNVGCRIITTNAAKKMNTEVGYEKNEKTGERDVITYTDYLMEYMTEMAGDIMVIHEPGQIWETQNLIRGKAKQRNMTAHIQTTRFSKAAGVVILLSDKWQKAEDTHYSLSPEGEQQRLMFIEFKGKERKKVWDAGKQKEVLAPLERMLVAAVYGYNNQKASTHQCMDRLWKSAFGKIDAYRKANKTATVILLGDLNAAKDPHLDTNRSQCTKNREQDAHIIEAIEGKGLIDIFRYKHPTTRAWTREPTGELTDTQAARRIDNILATPEIATHLATRVGIHTGYMLDSDHRPVVTDIPMDAANIAERIVPIWEPYTDNKTRMKETVADKERKEFDTEMSSRCENIKWHEMTGEEQAAAYNEAIMHAAEGTIAETKQITYPRPVKKLKHLMTEDFMLRTWKKRTENAIKAIDRKIIDDMRTPFRKATFPVPKVPEAIGITPVALDAQAITNLSKTKELLIEQKKKINAYLKPRQAKARSEKKRAAKKKRDEHFKEGSKGLGKFLGSIFKTVHSNQNLAWARRSDGTLADTPEEVGKLIRDKFERWFESMISVDERWGAEGWEKLMDMNIDNIDDSKRDIGKNTKLSFKDFVRECYIEPEYYKTATQEGWWDDMLKEITEGEINKAVKETKPGTAPGESQIPIDMIKALDNPGKHLQTMFNKFLKDRRIPDTMNTALIRLLPKTDAGLSNLDRTRPIALMETLTKLYERIIINRVTEAIDTHKIIDTSQYGALPKAGTAPPLRVLAEVMEDARITESELHVITLDLKKAFDTCEYWSQALSWRALGMPEEVIKILINLDAGSNSPADPHEGPGATTKVILDAGRKTEAFTHGRGVRQGSVGGPIKWVTFMHFWLTWIKRTMKGKGYTMSATRNQTITKKKRETQNPQVSPDTPQTEIETNKITTEKREAEMVAQMFIDDSIWTASNATHTQEILRRCEMFCDFHGIIVNKEKTEYIVMNHMHEPAVQIRWTPQKQYKTEEEKKEKMREIMDEWGEEKGAKRILGWLGKHNPMGSVLKPKGKTGKVRRDTKRDKEDGREIKYLGVYFEAQHRWHRQIEVLTQKHEALMANLKFVKISVEQAVTAINTKVIPAMMYALQVAVIPEGILQKWDRAHRRIVSKAGGIAHQGGMSPAIFHLPKEEGGIGLISIRDRADRIRMTAAIQAKNDYNIEEEEISTHAKITRAADIHRDNKYTLAGNTRKTLEKYQAAIHQTPTHMTARSAIEADRKAALTRKPTETVSIYTDGATIPGKTQKTAWGLTVIQEGEEIHKDSNRLEGAQENDLGEAMALLQALRSIHPKTEANIYIDNAGVVQTCEKKNADDPRKRHSQGGRAIWNRIQGLLKIRENTNIQWIHSHVDDERRQKWKEKCTMKCACGGQGRNKCDPDHEHHRGNDRADKIAGEAIAMETPKEKQLQALYGEDEYYMQIKGTICQGDITQECEKEITRKRIQELAGEEAGRKAHTWAKRWKAAAGHVTKTLCKIKEISTRFRVRLWADDLPTYYNEAKKTQNQGVKRELYGDNLEGGICRCCNTGAQETVEHLTDQCTHQTLTNIREKTRADIRKIWRDAGLQKEWEELSWIENAEQGWEPAWNYTGQVPKLVFERINEKCNRHTIHTAMKCTTETAKRVLTGTHEIWKARNEIKKEWEKQVGIDEKRRALGKQRWQTKTNKVSSKRGRPTQPIEQLQESKYKETRIAQETQQKLIQENGEEEGNRKYEEWKENKKVEKRLEKAKRTQGSNEIKRTLTKSSEIIRYKKVKAKTKQLGKTLRRYPEARNRQLCTVKGCEESGTYEAMQCRRKERRCYSHRNWSCIGKATYCACNTETKKKTAHMRKTEAQNINKGDWLIIATDEGWAEGEVISISTEKKRDKTYIIKTEETETQVIGYRTTEMQLREMDWWKVEDHNTDEGTDKETEIKQACVHAQNERDKHNKTEKQYNTEKNRETLPPICEHPATHTMSTHRNKTEKDNEHDQNASTTHQQKSNNTLPPICENDQETLPPTCDRQQGQTHHTQEEALARRVDTTNRAATETNPDKNRTRQTVKHNTGRDEKNYGPHEMAVKRINKKPKNSTEPYKSCKHPTTHEQQHAAAHMGESSTKGDEGHLHIERETRTHRAHHSEEDPCQRGESMDGKSNRTGKEDRNTAHEDDKADKRTGDGSSEAQHNHESRRRTRGPSARHTTKDTNLGGQENTTTKTRGQGPCHKPDVQDHDQRHREAKQDGSTSEGSHDHDGSSKRDDHRMGGEISNTRTKIVGGRSEADDHGEWMACRKTDREHHNQGTATHNKLGEGCGGDRFYRRMGRDEGRHAESDEDIWQRHYETIQGKRRRVCNTRHDDGLCSRLEQRHHHEVPESDRSEHRHIGHGTFQPRLYSELDTKQDGENAGTRTRNARRATEGGRGDNHEDGESDTTIQNKDEEQNVVRGGAAERISTKNTCNDGSTGRTDHSTSMLLRTKAQQTDSNMDKSIPAILEATPVSKRQVRSLQGMQRRYHARGADDAERPRGHNLQTSDTTRIHESSDAEQGEPEPCRDTRKSSTTEMERGAEQVEETSKSMGEKAPRRSGAAHLTNAAETYSSQSQQTNKEQTHESINQYNVIRHLDLVKDYVQGATPGKKRRTRHTRRERACANAAMWTLVAAGVVGTAVFVDLGGSTVFWENGTALRGAPPPHDRGPADDAGAAAAEQQKRRREHEDRLNDHRNKKKAKWKQKTLDGREFDSAD